MKFLIRQAKVTDQEQIKKLIALFPENLLQDHLPKAEDFFVAVYNKKIIGCCALEIFYKEGERNPRLAEIRSLSVSSDFQGQGVGTMLVKSCLKKAEKASVYEVFAFTDKLKFFEQFSISTFNGAKYAVFRVLGK
jgi:amino-acid N-acetyltransferase